MTVTWKQRMREAARDTFTTGELAELCGVTVAAIKQAEREGRIPAPPRDEGGFRSYDVELVTVIRSYFRS